MGKLIGIGGVSRAGKTSLADFINTTLPKVNILCQDDFPQREEIIPKIRERVDWEHPDSIDWMSWNEAVEKSLNKYPLTIIDGLFAFHNPEIEKKMDLKIYLSIDKEKFISHKENDLRWGNEPAWFIEHIWNSHFKFGLPHSDQGLIKIHNIDNSDYQSIVQKIRNI